MPSCLLPDARPDGAAVTSTTPTTSRSGDGAGPGGWNYIPLNPFNTTVQSTKIQTPSSAPPTSPGSTSRRAGATVNPGNTNYQSNAGADAYSFLTGTTSPGGPGTTNTFSGPFPSYSVCVKIARITDGTSNTVGFSEVVRGTGAYAGGFDGLKPSSSFANIRRQRVRRRAGPPSPQTDYTNCLNDRRRHADQRHLPPPAATGPSARPGGGAARARPATTT